MRPGDLARRAKERILDALGENQEELRPTHFEDIIGQTAAKSQLCMLIDSALARGEPCPHVLIDGPPGLGKTTLAGAMSSRAGGALWRAVAQHVSPDGLGKRLTVQPDKSVIFLDEVQTLSKSSQVMLLGAMEDLRITMSTPVGPDERDIRPFTLIGATTSPGSLSEPFRDRFGHTVQLTYYDTNDMIEIIRRAVGVLDTFVMSEDAIHNVAEKGHGVPRVALGYLYRIRDFWQVKNDPDIPVDFVLTEQAFEFLSIDTMGFGPREREYLKVLYVQFQGGPVGSENLAIRLGTDVRTIQSDVEPLLLRLGIVARARGGRLLTGDGRAFCEGMLRGE